MAACGRTLANSTRLGQGLYAHTVFSRVFSVLDVTGQVAERVARPQAAARAGAFRALPLGKDRNTAAIAPGAGKTEVGSSVDSDGVLSPPGWETDKRRLDGRVHKWFLHSAVKALLPDHLAAACCSSVLAPERRGVVGVEVWKSTKHGTAHYGNLFTCGYVWSCPICAPKVAARRAAEVEQAITNHQRAGGRVMLLTLTVPHYVSDDLGELLPSFTKALSSFWSRRAVKSALAGVGFLGSIRALEVTHGGNGWHPHTHYLLFVDGDAEVLDVSGDLYDQWERVVAQYLGRQINGHGFTLLRVGGGAQEGGTYEDAAQLSRYVVKSLEESVWGIAQEISKGHIKNGREGGRTPFALLNDYATDGDKRAGALFVEFVRQFHDRRQLSWSKGLRKKLLDQDQEATDQELAEQIQEEATLLGTLTLEQWRRVLAARRKDTRGLLLEVAAAGGWSAVLTFLETVGSEVRRPVADERSTPKAGAV